LNGTAIRSDQMLVAAIPSYYLGDPLFQNLTVLVDEDSGIGDDELLLSTFRAMSPIAPIVDGRIVPLG